MKTVKFIFACAAAAGIFASCTKENIATASSESIPEGCTKAVFRSLDSKSTLDGKTIKWDETDYLVAYSFTGSATAAATGYKFTKSGEDITSSAEFTGTVVSGAEVAYVAYPFFESASSTTSTLKCDPSTKTIVATVPGAQALRDGSFDKACNLSACKATISTEEETTVLSGTMTNLVSYLKFTMDGTKNITQVLVETVNNTKISGMSTITFDEDGVPAATCLESHYVVGHNKGAVIPSGTYYLCAVPSDLTTEGKAGLKITLSASDGKIYETSTDGFNMERNKVYNLGNIESAAAQNASLLSVMFDCSSMGTSKSTARTAYTFTQNGTDYTVGYLKYYNKDGKILATSKGFLTTPQVSGKKLVKVNVTLDSHNTNYKILLALKNDTGTAAVGSSYATGTYCADRTEVTSSRTLALLKLPDYSPSYFHQLYVGHNGDRESQQTSFTTTEPYQIYNNGSSQALVKVIEFVYETASE